MLLIFPLFTGFSGYSNITLSKYIFFVSATGLWIIALLASSLRERATPVRLQFPQWAALAFLFLCLLSTLFSPWRAESIIGRGRYDGLVTLLLYGAVFLGISLFSRPKAVHMAAFGLSISLCCLVALFQLFDIDILGLYPRDLSYYDAGILYSSTFLGTIGNTNILASLLALACPLFFALYVCGLSLSGLGLIPMALSALILVLSHSDSGLLGLAVCALIGAPVIFSDMARIRRGLAAAGLLCLSFALAYAFRAERSDGLFRWSMAFGPLPLSFLLLSLILVLLSFVLTRIRLSPTAGSCRRFFAVLSVLILLSALALLYGWQGTEGPLYEFSRLLHGHWDDRFGSSRLLIWRSCLELVPQRLLLGGGPGTLPLRLDIEFSRQVAETGGTLRSSVDNAHNEYLSYLVNIGLPGLLAYLAILVSGLRRWIKDSHQSFAAALGLGLAACCTQAFFGLGLCLSAPVFWIFLGLIHSRGTAPSYSPGGYHEE